MFRAKHPDELVTYVGHVLHPHKTCTGAVEVWDQTIGCPTCGKELWTGLTREDEFHAEHPFILTDAHDDGDEAADAWDTVGGYVPFGGWRDVTTPPVWHGIGFSWPLETVHAWRTHGPTEHVFPVDMTSNHDPGDVG